jgi:hypothetical protein
VRHFGSDSGVHALRTERQSSLGTNQQWGPWVPRCGARISWDSIVKKRHIGNGVVKPGRC